MSAHDRAAFVTLTFSGERFAADGLPVEVAPELLAYQKLVIEVAKQIFFEDHHGRQRVPRGFFDSLGLRITEVAHRNSVDVDFSRRHEPSFAANLCPPDLFDRSVERIGTWLGALADELPLPPEALRVGAAFKRFGQSLRPDEAICVRVGDSVLGALAHDSRQRALRQLQASPTYSVEFECEGSLRGVFQDVSHDRLDFSFVVAGTEEQVDVRLQEEHKDTLRRLLPRLFDGAAELHLSGRGTFDQEGRLHRIDEVYEMTPLDSEPAAQLAEHFDKLANRWLDETAFVSSTHELIGHPTFQEIVALGRQVVPLLLDRIEREPHWASALAIITGENPVPSDSAGRVDEVARAWLDWGRRGGHVA